MRHLIIIPALICLGTAAAAHPHVFVNTEVQVLVNDAGTVYGVRLTWIYDDFFSLLVTEDMGIDSDGDLILTAAETTALTDYITDWPADYDGDLYVTQDGRPVALGEVTEHSVAMVDGLISETYERTFASPADIASPVLIQVYDPYYYVAYSVVGDLPVVGGTGCETAYQAADLNAAYSKVDELLYGRPASDVGPDEQFPEVGALFADTVIVTCGA